MADSFQVDLVSPERRLASVAATKVQVPGMMGDLTAMPNHAPFLTTLRPGVVTVTSAEGTTEYVVTGGFAEITGDAASILAERAVPRDEVSADMLGTLQEEAEAALADAPDDGKMAADQRRNDVLQLRRQLGV